MHKFIIFALLIFGIAGCATAPPVVKTSAPPVPGVPGVYHRVEKGQTLWRISKMYNVDLDELAGVNRITDASSLDVDRQIFIPRRQKVIQATRTNYAGDDFTWPLSGKVIGYYGQTYANLVNKGLNIRPAGNTDVKAVRGGRVVFVAENFGGFGKTIIIDHGDGLSTVYARNKEIFVKAGDSVRAQTLIAACGSGGRDKETYLHFEIRKNHIPQNPLFYLPRDN